MTPDFHLEAQMRDGAYIIAVSGEVDLENADTLPEAARLGDGSADGVPVLFDLSEVDFIDSSGLRGLLEARRHLDERGRPLALLRPSPPVLRMLELIDLTDEIPVVGSTAAAELARLR